MLLMYETYVRACRPPFNAAFLPRSYDEFIAHEGPDVTRAQCYNHYFGEL
jgi:hypothetical protein